jgi:hypothetical protein
LDHKEKDEEDENDKRARAGCLHPLASAEIAFLGSSLFPPICDCSTKLLVVDIAPLAGPSLASEGFRPAQTFSRSDERLPGLLPDGGDSGGHARSNGLFFKDLRKVLFWEQSAALVEGPRIWDEFRARGGKVGMMFWQQSMGERVDLAVTPGADSQTQRRDDSGLLHATGGAGGAPE